MKSLAEGKASVENDNTTLTSQSRQTQKKLFRIGYSILAGITCTVLVTVYVHSRGEIPKVSAASRGAVRAEIPLASWPQSSWPKLVISAGGRSELIPVPPSMHIVMSGNNFLNHNVYVDGTECAFGEPCVAGPLKGNYATNEAVETNIVSYAFAPD